MSSSILELQTGRAIGRTVLLIPVTVCFVVDQVSMTIDTLLLHARKRVQGRLVGQSGTAAIGDAQQIAMAFLTLSVLEGCIGCQTVFFPVIGFKGEMLDQVFDPMKCLGVKEVQGVLGRRQVTIHAVGHEALGVINMR